MEVRVADYDGYNQFIVNRSSQPIMSPAWSPDGKRLAYVSFENKKSQLVVQDLGSGSRKVVASFPGHNGAPAFLQTVLTCVCFFTRWFIKHLCNELKWR